MSSQQEREAKLAVLNDFELPEVAPFTLDSPVEKRLDATYVDTDDFRLARRGITLRYRTDSSEQEPSGWTLKLPEGGEQFISRQERFFPGEPGVVPTEVSQLVGGLVGDRSLGPVAHMVTDRQERIVRDGTERLAALTDDRVSTGDRYFREIEVELVGDADPERLQPLLDHLTNAGARRATNRSKLHTVLGPTASLPALPVVETLTKRSTAADLVRHAIGKSTNRLIEQSFALQLSGGDIETVHQARVATRRLRSDLRTFRRLFDPDWVESLREELRWIASPLGAVRDLDVMVDRLAGVTRTMNAADQPHGDALVDRLRAQRATALEQLLQSLHEPRFSALIGRLIDASEHAPFTEEANGKAAKVLIPVVKHPWRRLRAEVKQLDDPPTDEALHEVRIKAKRARYALEAAEPVLGKSAERHAEAIAELQGVLGDLHDTAVAQDRLRQIGGSYADPQAALVVGTLIGWEQAQHDLLRQQWESIWEKASKKKLRRWAG